MPKYRVRLEATLEARTPSEAEFSLRSWAHLPGYSPHESITMEEVKTRRFRVREYRDWFVDVESTRDEEWSSVKRKALAETEPLMWCASQVEVTEVMNP